MRFCKSTLSVMHVHAVVAEWLAQHLSLELPYQAHASLSGLHLKCSLTNKLALTPRVLQTTPEHAASVMSPLSRIL